MRNFLSLLLLVSLALIISSCSSEKKSAKAPATTNTAAVSDTAKTQPPLARTDRYYVLDKRQRTIFEINLNNNTISNRFLLADNAVAIAYDMKHDWVYEAIGEPRPGLRVLDPKDNKTVQTFEFPQPPSDIMYNPVKDQLFLVSEDSTYIKVFSPDSLKFIFNYPLWVVDKAQIGPRTISPGPAGKIVTANGPRASVTEILTDNKYAYQTVIIHEAKSIDYAVFSFDGNSAFCCDTDAGKLFRVEFGTGNILAKKAGLDHPRLVQFEVESRTVVLVVDKTKVLMLNQDSLAETGKVDLADYGDDILSLQIPPKANFVELTMDYKGVTRWLRLDIKNWEPLRLVELI